MIGVEKRKEKKKKNRRQREAHNGKSFPLLEIASIASITERTHLDFLLQRPLLLTHCFFYLYKNRAYKGCGSVGGGGGGGSRCDWT